MSEDGVEEKIVVSPADVQVASEVIRDKATLLFGFVNHVSLIHHVPVTKGDESFEVVGEKLAANVDPLKAKEISSSTRPEKERAGRRAWRDSPLDGRVNDLPFHDRNDVSVRVSSIDEDVAFRETESGLRTRGRSE